MKRPLHNSYDLAGPDRVTGQATRYVQLSGDWHQESASWTYPDSGSSIPLTNAIARTRLTGLGSAYSANGASGTLTAESVSIDARGNQNVSRTVTDRDNKTVYQVTATPDSTVAALTVAVNGLLQSSRSTHDLTTTYAYDALGRQNAVQDARGAVHSRGYDDAGRVVWVSDPATNGTWYAYDAFGRRTAVTNALGQVTHTAYDLEGRVIATWGATYPVAYEYDASGRMTAMATTRDAAHESVNLLTLLPAGVHLSHLSHPSYPAALDTTRWYYDAPTGLLTNKLYADGKGTAYTYTPDGKLETRNWARGVTTTYAYTNGSSLAAIDYSDDTPDVAFTYDRLGRQVSAIVAGVSTNLFVYDGLDLVSETQNGVVLSRATDALGREQALSLNSCCQSVWNYDTLGRVDGVAWTMPGYTNAALFGRITNSDLSAGWSIRPVPSMGDFSQIWSQRSVIAAADPIFAHERGDYDLRGLVGEVANTADAGVLSLHRYDHDALGRRTARVDSGTAYPNAAFDRYGYNGRSEVVSGQRYYGTDSADTSAPYGGRSFGYGYDAIGNRITATDQIGGTTLTRTYTANALNQYTAIANPAAVGLRGEAVSNATVTVNSEPVEQDQPASDTWPWHFALDAENADGPDFPLAEMAAVINPPGTNDPDIVELRSGFLYAPPQNETMIHDHDGNLTQDGRFAYTWDAENRLIAVEEQVCPTNRALRRVEYAYDHQSRRIARREYVQSGSQWQPETARAFTYDGWNVVQETINHQQPTTNHYVWGLDLSGTRTGAGGIGGLLAAVLSTNEGHTVCTAYGFDANGNVTVLAAGGNGDPFVLASSLEYDPFGRVVAHRAAPGHEPLATANRYRFSTKWQDPLTRLSDYGFRWYDAVRGRWPSRDPIGEFGGRNLYGFAFNAATFRVDTDGRFVFPVVIIPPDTVPTTWTCSSAKARCQEKIDEWKKKGYDLAIDLLEHYLDNSGDDYSLSDENIEELKEHAGDKICSKVGDAVCGMTGSPRSISIAPEDEDESNVRWWYMGSDKNMLFAYGGARLTVVGDATMDNANWSGTFNVTLADKYEWDKTDGLSDEVKETLSALWSDAYSAALYLQKNCGYSPFSHSTDFELPCSGCCD